MFWLSVVSAVQLEYEMDATEILPRRTSKQETDEPMLTFSEATNMLIRSYVVSIIFSDKRMPVNDKIDSHVS